MIRIDDVTLRVKKIRQSRNGAFCVADLSTEIGEFKVKDPLLDQFEEGEYQATVWITEIFLAQYISYGKAVTEMRARLHDLQVRSAGELGDSRSEPVEPDPLDEPTPTRVEPATEAPATAKAQAEGKFGALKNKLASIRGRKSGETRSGATLAPSNHEDSTLFGDELWSQIQARSPVKLDATVDRALLRKQAALMGQMNFKFDPIAQIWNPL